VLICLKYLSSDNFQLDVSDRLKVSQGHSSSIIFEVANAIAKRAGDFIKFPQEADKINAQKREFFDVAGFPSVIGLVDCTHVLLRVFIFFNR
jgi:hypothetical protein